MKITFFADDPKWSGLDLNGGSRTLVKSSIVLRELGNKVSIVAHKDKYHWDLHPPCVKKVPKDTEVLIAVTISDVKHVMNYCEKHQNVKMACWLRPYEVHSDSQKWQMPEEKAMKLLYKFQRRNGVIMTNGGWLHDWLKLHNINSFLIYSGQDIECEFKKPDFDPNDGFPLTIGCQYSSKPRKGWKEFKKIVKMLGTENCDYVAFGSEKCKAGFLSEYLRNPTRQDLNALYRRMDVFVCCSSLEGFYNPGVEATINGCLLLVNDNPRNGTRDYANPFTAEFYNSPTMDDYLDSKMQAEYLCKLFKNLNFDLVEKCQQLIREKIGTRTVNMKKMVEVLSE